MAGKASEQRYKALIERLQAQAREAPQAYRTRVMLLASLGYAVLGLILLVALGLPIGIVIALLASGGGFDPWVIYLLLPQTVFAAMVVRALWLRFDAPSGYRLAPGEAPGLEAQIERLRLAAGAPPLEAVVIDSDLNAGAASMPRLLGLLGDHHYLVIGLPLMRLLDAAELSAVIAHEFGHFRGGHGRFSGWIYRVRISWYRLVEAMARGGGMMSRLFLKFFEWYVPYFNAYSFVMARGRIRSRCGERARGRRGGAGVGADPSGARLAMDRAEVLAEAAGADASTGASAAAVQRDAGGGAARIAADRYRTRVGQR